MTKLLLALSMIISISGFAEAQASQCVSKLITRNGRVIDQFYAYSNYSKREACMVAKSQCRSELRRRQRRGNNPYARCVVPGGRGNGSIVRKSCSAELVNRRGRILEVVSAQARGPRGSGVKAQACRRAMRRCQDVKYRRNTPYATCYRRQ